MQEIAKNDEQFTYGKSSTMTSSSSRPNSSSSSLRPGSRQSGRNNNNSRPNTPNVVRFKETVEINIGKPPVYGKNMGDEYYNKIGPSPPKASKRALKRGEFPSYIG